MKLILLAAAVALAAPAVAQTTTDTQSDSAMPAGMTPGGYQPATPPMATPAPPGATVQFVPSQSPDQAFPPPPAKADYPWCKPGQTNGCMERENGRHQGLHHQHR